jgi:hypothetical protein
VGCLQKLNVRQQKGSHTVVQDRSSACCALFRRGGLSIHCGECDCSCLHPDHNVWLAREHGTHCLAEVGSTAVTLW